MDPHGYLEGKEVPESRKYLKVTGDMIGTFMAWLGNVGAGGGTSFVTPGKAHISHPQNKAFHYVKGGNIYWTKFQHGFHVQQSKTKAVD